MFSCSFPEMSNYMTPTWISNHTALITRGFNKKKFLKEGAKLNRQKQPYLNVHRSFSWQASIHMLNTFTRNFSKNMAKFQLTSGSSIGQESCSVHPHLLITRLITLPIHQAPKKAWLWHSGKGGSCTARRAFSSYPLLQAYRKTRTSIWDDSAKPWAASYSPTIV